MAKKSTLYEDLVWKSNNTGSKINKNQVLHLEAGEVWDFNPD